MIMIQDGPLPTGADKPLRITGDAFKVQVCNESKQLPQRAEEKFKLQCICEHLMESNPTVNVMILAGFVCSVSLMKFEQSKVKYQTSKHWLVYSVTQELSLHTDITHGQEKS